MRSGDASGITRPSAAGAVPAPGSVMSSTGTTISRSRSLRTPASTTSHSRRGPTRNLAIRSRGLCVADSPIRWGSRPAGLAPRANQMRETLDGQRQVRAALRLSDRVDLVDDHRLDAREDLAGLR